MHITEFSVIKRNKILIHATRHVNLKNIVSEITPAQKEKDYDSIYTKDLEETNSETEIRCYQHHREG